VTTLSFLVHIKVFCRVVPYLTDPSMTFSLFYYCLVATELTVGLQGRCYAYSADVHYVVSSVRITCCWLF